MEDKEHKNSSMTEDYIDSLIDLESTVGQGLEYKNIRDQIIREMPGKKFKIAKTGSAYSAYPGFNRMYATLRISNHLPSLSNLLKNASELPTKQETGNMSLMFFGSEEAKHEKSIPNNSWPYEMDEDRVTIYVPKNYTRTKHFFSNGETIKYKIYHYIPNYLSEQDVSKISKASDDWLNDGGRFRFFLPDISNEDAYEGVIICDAMFVYNESYNNVSPNILNENEHGEYNSPLDIFYLGKITYMEENTNKVIDTAGVFLRIWEVSTPNLMYLLKRTYKKINFKVVNNYIKNKKKELEKIPISIENTFNDSKQLDYFQKKEIYEITMSIFSNALKKALGMNKK